MDKISFCVDGDSISLSFEIHNKENFLSVLEMILSGSLNESIIDEVQSKLPEENLDYLYNIKIDDSEVVSAIQYGGIYE